MDDSQSKCWKSNDDVNSEPQRELAAAIPSVLKDQRSPTIPDLLIIFMQRELPWILLKPLKPYRLIFQHSDGNRRPTTYY